MKWREFRSLVGAELGRYDLILYPSDVGRVRHAFDLLESTLRGMRRIDEATKRRARLDVARTLTDYIRARDGAEHLDPATLARLTTADTQPGPDDPVVTGWRFARVADTGALLSPFQSEASGEWAPAGVRAVCGQRHPSRPWEPLRVWGEHYDRVPVRHCGCGVYLSESLGSLVSRLASDPSSDAAPEAWARVAPEVFVEVEGWGPWLHDHADHARDKRSRYMRVKAGGLLLLAPSKAEHAATLADLYGVDVEPGEQTGPEADAEWLASLRDRFPAPAPWRPPTPSARPTGLGLRR